MRDIYTRINNLRRQVFSAVANLAYEDRDLSEIVEIPFEIPFSVINSPIHIRRIDPTAIANPDKRTVVRSVEITAPPSILLTRYTDPIPCKKANGKVRYLVYWLIFAWPTSPCSESSSTAGTITPRSCIIIDAVIYGEIPIAIKANLSKAPPRSITKYQNSEPALRVWLIKAVISANGIGIKTNSLYIANIPMVNRILFLIFLFPKTSRTFLLKVFNAFIAFHK